MGHRARNFGYCHAWYSQKTQKVDSPHSPRFMSLLFKDYGTGNEQGKGRCLLKCPLHHVLQLIYKPQYFSACIRILPHGRHQFFILQ